MFAYVWSLSGTRNDNLGNEMPSLAKTSFSVLCSSFESNSAFMEISPHMFCSLHLSVLGPDLVAGPPKPAYVWISDSFTVYLLLSLFEPKYDAFIFRLLLHIL